MIAASSVGDGRGRIERFERLLRELGLRLNVAKTRIMRSETYRRNLNTRSPRLEARRAYVLALTEERLMETEEADEVEEILRAAGVDEETLWDVLYHHTTPLEEVIRQIRDEFRPESAEAYREFFHQTAQILGAGDLPPDMLAAEADLRECLIIFAGVGLPVSWTDVDTTLRWFPRTADVVSEYLVHRADDDPGGVRRFIRRWLLAQETSDWARAWITSATTRKPNLIDRELATSLRTVARSSSAGLLTKEAALLGLRASDQADQKTWQGVTAVATPAIRSELKIVALQHERHASQPNEPSTILDDDPDILAPPHD